MRIYAPHELATADLHVDAIYSGVRANNASADPLPALISVDNQGGFRKRGKVAGQLNLLALTSSMSDADWPDSLDRETGVFTYYGDNKKPGRDLHDTGRDGNLILQRIFEAARTGPDGRRSVPPILLFASTGTWRDYSFLGLAVPGASELDAPEELVAIWRLSEGKRFQNYRARFTVLDAPIISRNWLDSIIAGKRDDTFAPREWLVWRESGRRQALRATRSIEWRNRAEQLPDDKEGKELIRAIQQHFEGNPHGFEYFAVAIAKLMIPEITELEVTRLSRDGGRDAIGKMRIGKGPSSILVDFALEAKCFTDGAVGVKPLSRLISRLRHRQFGILVTTTWLDRQAYKEIKEDDHPIIVIAAIDIVSSLRDAGRGSSTSLRSWLAEEFAQTTPIA